MNEEIPLTGGRVTNNVTKIGKFVHRPCCNNSSFVHNVLLWIEQKILQLLLILLEWLMMVGK